MGKGADMTERQCGDCTLCCKLLPVRSLAKPAGVKCRHQRFHKGCAIYNQRPPECFTWNCRWLGDPEATKGLPRPDHAHYVVDIMPDYITVEDNATGQQTDIQVIQVWIDLAHPEAHRHPALRAYLAREAEINQCAAVIRYDGERVLTLFPPALNASGEWNEVAGGTVVENTPERMRYMLGLGERPA